MKKVLFVCVENSCRSQMAEGWTKHLKSDLIDAYSAGIESHGLHPNAVKVMAESGEGDSDQCQNRAQQHRTARSERQHGYKPPLGE